MKPASGRNSWPWTPLDDVDAGERARFLAASPLAGCTWGDISLPAWAGRIAELEERERFLRGQLATACGGLARADTARRWSRGALSWLTRIAVAGALVALGASLR